MSMDASKDAALSTNTHASDPQTASTPIPVTKDTASTMEAPKSKNQEKKERLKAEKLEKFKAKQAKVQQPQQSTASVPKKKVEKSHAVDAYEPSKIEQGRYEWWEERGYFKPQFTDGKINPAGKFVIPIPPPNVTGSLHMGHALTNALQDLMIRHARMRGKSTLWLPGCDHASISTQSVVEKMLWKTKKVTRHDIGREKMLEEIWDWTKKYRSHITNQLKRLGGSMDWTREAFTMDENLSRAVQYSFIELHKEGTIYRANRLVNWSSALSTSLSNLEVDNKELTGRTKLTVPGYAKKIDFGVLTYFKYLINQSSDSSNTDGDSNTTEFIEVATTRPETILGDTAIAVHPTDKRYSHLVGRTAVHPFIPDRIVRIIADEEVDSQFGTGAVKITPAHDTNDFTKAKRHNLEFINILTDDGHLNENAGPFAGQGRFEARYTVVAALKEKGLYVREEEHAMTIPLCNRSKDVVEPLLRPQWWMKMGDMARAADKAVADGEITIQPESELRKFHQWMGNIQDWCLSRQLWWGHRPPAYHIRIEGMDHDATSADDAYWVCAPSESEARVLAEEKFPGKVFTLHQDEDVLDTWYSSGLWPWATLGWPEKTHDYESFYPTSCLETGWDIIFFWVARMIMLGIKLTGKVPFTEVYCHSLVRDSDGRKMSKSLGNVVDPLDVINGTTLEKLHAQLLSGNLDPTEVTRASAYQKSAFPTGIPECGADALRFTLINYTTGGGDIAFDIKEIEAKRRFCNKIYQATNFVLGRLGNDFQPAASPLNPKSLPEEWILHKLNATAQTVTNAIETRNFSTTTLALYQYWLYDLCDTFIENTKSALQADAPATERESIQQTLYTALESGLLLLHPVMPYLTEHLWQKLPRRQGDETPSIMVAKYPEYRQSWDKPESVRSYEFILSIADGIRSITSDFGLKQAHNVLIRLHDEDKLKLVEQQVAMVKSLGGKFLGEASCELAPRDRLPPSGYALKSINADSIVLLELGSDVDLSSLVNKQKQSLENARKKVQKSQEMMEKSGWAKASAETKDKEAAKLRDAESEVFRLEDSLKELERLQL